MPEIQNVPINKLSLLEKNPRTISKEQMQKLCISITEDPDFLWDRPILVNEVDGKFIVYAGNQRVRAAKSLKMKEIPCIIRKDLDEEIVKSRTIKDNKTYGEFDFDILANEWDIEMLLKSGFNAEELIGKDSDEIENVESEDKKEKDSLKCELCGKKL